MIRMVMPLAPHTSYAVVVLGARLRPDGGPTPLLRRRVATGAALWQSMAAHGSVGPLIVSGGATGGSGQTEAAVMAALAHEAGVPPSATLTEPQARTTRDNARFALALLRPVAGGVPPGGVVVVSDGWHLPRALMLFRRAGRRAGLPELVVRGLAVPTDARRLSWWLAAVREIPAYAADIIRG